MSEALDLFAGAGGWDLAARALGIEAHGVENMPAARATRDAAGLSTIHDDVWTLGEAFDVLEHADPGSTAFARALHMASPPCQTFSAAGKGAGRRAINDVLRAIQVGAYRDLIELRAFGTAVGDERTALVLTPLYYAMRYRPRAIAWEQVPTVLPVWEACAEVLRAHGYSVWTGNLQAEQYGVPQTRKRALLLASLDREVSMPTPTHSRYYPRDPKRLDEGVAPWVSMAEALNGFGLVSHPAPTITGGGTETGGAEPIAKLARYTERDDWQGRRLASGAQRRLDPDGARVSQRTRAIDEPASTITGAGNSAWVLRNNNTANAAVRSIDQPAPTLYFGQRCNYVAWEEPSRDSVRVTVAEAGVLQSFPADYLWQGAKGKQYLQVGNAIPPLLALHSLAEVLGVSLTDRLAA